ncbi:MAG TPA: CBS domain-containing protein [Acidimicrobiia bacterium]|nr:CBS domain-containing protein [Acidimicrobiia bacterium]
MLVRELLGGEVDTCPPHLSMVAAARRMIDEDIGSLAVVDAGELVGIVTERDVLRAVADEKLGRRSKVAEVMTPRPDSLEPDVDVQEASEWMMAAGYRHLPVTDSGELIGMVSIKDLMWALTEAAAGRTGV